MGEPTEDNWGLWLVEQPPGMIFDLIGQRQVSLSVPMEPFVFRFRKDADGYWRRLVDGERYAPMDIYLSARFSQFQMCSELEILASLAKGKKKP